MRTIENPVRVDDTIPNLKHGPTASWTTSPSCSVLSTTMHRHCTFSRCDCTCHLRAKDKQKVARDDSAVGRFLKDVDRLGAKVPLAGPQRS